MVDYWSTSDVRSFIFDQFNLEFFLALSVGAYLTDKKEHVHDVSSRIGASVNEQLDAWTAHKTDTGIVYYYNAVTGESTYEKPAGFKGEV